MTRQSAGCVSITEKVASSAPRKIRNLIKDLQDAGFEQIAGAGKGSHRKFVHLRYAGAVTLSGKEGDDVKPYQEKQVKKAIDDDQS